MSRRDPCRTAFGTPKARYLDRVTARAEVARLSAQEGIMFNDYFCTGCRRYHVGRASMRANNERAKHRLYESVLVVELGIRALSNLQAGDAEAALASRVAAAERKASTRQRPGPVSHMDGGLDRHQSGVPVR